MDAVSHAPTTQVAIPADVQTFLIDFHAAVYDRDYELMRRLYEQDFNQLTETHYPNSRWPEQSTVEAFYAERNLKCPLMIALYCELYYRHVLARCSADVNWKDRYYSSCNYMQLLQYFIDEECRQDNTSVLAIPAQWLWDMVDEFVYQFQETQRWKAQYAEPIASCPIAMEALRSGRQAWTAHEVLRILAQLVEHSGIKTWLANQRNPSNPPATPPILLGYFAIISTIRLFVAIGDYRGALEASIPIELSSKALYWQVPACNITLYYNLGFAYMMMRRYQNATRVLSQILTFVSKSRSYLASQSYQQEVMTRMTDRMYHLIMLCNALSPTRLEETIQAHIQERWADKYFKLQNDDDEIFREVFVKACPKFFSPVVFDYEDPNEQMHIDENEPLNRQLNMFLKDVSFQSKVFNVRSIAKLYNNLTLSKLANLMNMKQENAVEIVRSEMLCVKNRAEQLIWQSGPFLSGDRVQMLADLDIYLEMDTIHVKKLVSHRSYAENFIKQIARTQVTITHAETRFLQELLNTTTARSGNGKPIKYIAS